MVFMNNKHLTYNKHILLSLIHFNLFNISKLCTLVSLFFQTHDMWFQYLLTIVNLVHFPPKKRRSLFLFSENNHKIKETIWTENVVNVESVKM